MMFRLTFFKKNTKIEIKLDVHEAHEVARIEEQLDAQMRMPTI
jgi:hypothetical protein